jgi:hypothetical protein
MLDSHRALSTLTGRLVMVEFQMLSAGIMGQAGAPGTVVAARAGLAISRGTAIAPNTITEATRIRRGPARANRCVTS